MKDHSFQCDRCSKLFSENTYRCKECDYDVCEECYEYHLGKIYLPFIEHNEASVKKAVLCHEGFAELVNISLKKESYDFKCSYLYSDESMIMGNKAKIII